LTPAAGQHGVLPALLRPAVWPPAVQFSPALPVEQPAFPVVPPRAAADSGQWPVVTPRTTALYRLSAWQYGPVPWRADARPPENGAPCKNIFYPSAAPGFPHPPPPAV